MMLKFWLCIQPVVAGLLSHQPVLLLTHSAWRVWRSHRSGNTAVAAAPAPPPGVEGHGCRRKRGLVSSRPFRRLSGLGSGPGGGGAAVVTGGVTAALPVVHVFSLGVLTGRFVRFSVQFSAGRDTADPGARGCGLRSARLNCGGSPASRGGVSGCRSAAGLSARCWRGPRRRWSPFAPGCDGFLTPGMGLRSLRASWGWPMDGGAGAVRSRMSPSLPGSPVRPSQSCRFVRQVPAGAG